jgi:hypothetical protein
MSSIDLTQAEADSLMAMAKVKNDDAEWDFPNPGSSVSIPLTSKDKRETFMLDIGKGRIDLSKVKYQNRARQIVVLIRLELNGPPHRNPDNEDIPCPHLHIYREGYGDKWAFPVPSDKFSNLQDAWKALDDFMNYCNIVEPPLINKGLFT